MFAVATITKITLDADNLFRHRQQLFRQAKANHLAQAGVGGFVAVGRTHAAAHGNVKSD